VSAAPNAAAAEVKLIKMGQRALGLDDGTYRAMLANLCGGKTSSTALTAQERQRVLSHLKASGFKIVPKAGKEAGWPRAAQMRKLRAMWHALADAGEVSKPGGIDDCNAAIEAWAIKRLRNHKPPLERIRFATGRQMDTLIEQLKAYCTRCGVSTETGG